MEDDDNEIYFATQGRVCVYAWEGVSVCVCVCMRESVW